MPILEALNDDMLQMDYESELCILSNTCMSDIIDLHLKQTEEKAV